MQFLILRLHIRVISVAIVRRAKRCRASVYDALTPLEVAVSPCWTCDTGTQLKTCWGTWGTLLGHNGGVNVFFEIAWG